DRERGAVAAALMRASPAVTHLYGPRPAGPIVQPEVVDDRALEPRGLVGLELARHHPEDRALGLRASEDLLQPRVGRPADESLRADLAAPAEGLSRRVADLAGQVTQR